MASFPLKNAHFSTLRLLHPKFQNFCLALHIVSKNSQNCFHRNFVKFQSTLIIFGTDMAKTIQLCKVYFFSPRLIYFNALPCETQML